MRERQDKSLCWTDGRGESPILCAFHNSTNAVVIDKAAEIRQAITTIHEASSKAGFCAIVTPHDLRRGAAKDTAHSKHTPRGLATPAVAAELGQSVRSLDAGITAAYVGSRNEDSWSRRVSAGFEDPFGINVTNNVYKRRKMSKEEMTQLYVDVGIDASSANERRKARRKYEAVQEKLWGESQGGQKSGKISQLQFSFKFFYSNTLVIVLQEKTPSQINARTQTTPSSSSQKIGTAYSEHAAQDQDIVAENLEALIGNTEGAQLDEETAQVILFNEMETPFQLPQELDVPGTDFVNFLAQINIIRHGVHTEKEERRIIDKYAGNSRNKPTAYIHKCDRCRFKARWLRDVKRHEPYCRK